MCFVISDLIDWVKCKDFDLGWFDVVFDEIDLLVVCDLSILILIADVW